MRRTLTIALLAAAAVAPAVAQDRDAGVDVVFVVDSSNSMSRNDPEGLRVHFMSMTVDFMQGRSGDRVAVAQFAGWEETQKRNVIVFPLTKLPEPGRSAEFRAAFGAALGKAEIFGQASDINVAFEKGLAEIEKQRGASRNPYWIIVLSDAALNAVEPSGVRAEYRAKAAEMFKVDPDDVDIDQINQAALEVFRTQVLPKYSKGGLDISAVNLSKRAVKPESPLQQLVGKDRRVGTVTETPLKDLVIPMLAGSALYGEGKGGFYGYAHSSGDRTSRTARVHGGAQGARLLVFARGAEVSVKVSGQAPGFDPSMAEVLGAGPYRVVHFRGAPPGDYDVEIEAPRAVAGIESVAYAGLPWSGDVKMLTPASISAGEEARFEVVVTAGAATLTDAGSLKDLSAKVTVKSAAGEQTRDIRFSGESKAEFTWPTDAGAPPGTIEFTFVLAGVPDGTAAPHAWRGVTKSFQVRTATVLEASFDKEQVFIDETGGFAVKGARGTPPSSLLKELKLRRDGRDLSVPVRFEKDRWVGAVPTDKAGEYEVVAGDGEGYVLRAGAHPKLKVAARAFTARFSAKDVFVRQPATVHVDAPEGTPPGLLGEVKLKSGAIPVKWSGKGWTGEVDTTKERTIELAEDAQARFVVRPGDPATLTIRPRAFRVLDAAGQPVEKLVFDVKFAEKGDYTQELELSLDVGEGEAGTVASSGESTTKDVSVGLASAPKPLTAAAPRQKVSAKLVIATDADLEESPTQLATLVLKAQAGELTWEKRLPVEVKFTDKPWKLFLRYLPFLIAGLVLLLMLLWFLLLARWKQQQIRVFRNNNLDEKHLLSTMGGGRSATGTAESPGAAAFKLSGMKFTANVVRLRALKPDVQVKHKGRVVTEPSVLAHGDEISVEVGASPQFYVYFEREPTAEELKKALDGLVESDEFFIEDE